MVDLGVAITHELHYYCTGSLMDPVLTHIDEAANLSPDLYVSLMFRFRYSPAEAQIRRGEIDTFLVV